MKLIDSLIALTIASDGFFLEDPKPPAKPKDIGEHLKRMTSGEDDEEDQVLVFDPKTGELIVQSPNEAKPNPDSVIATSIAKDGFFKG